MQINAQEHPFQRLLDAAADAMLVVDAGGAVVAANASAARLFGYEQRALLHRAVEDLIPERYRAAHRDERAAYARRPGVRPMGGVRELRGLRRDGTEFFVEVSLGPIDVSNVLVTVVDVTERKHAEETLRKFSRVVQQTASTVMITNLDGVIEYVNPRFIETTGYSADEAIGQRPSLLKSGHTPLEEYRQLWRTITGGGVWNGEFLNRRKDGSLYWESAIISPIRDEGGVVTHFAAVKDDITARKAADAALREREEQLRLFIEHAPVALAMFDDQMRYVAVSTRWLADYGLSRRNVIGRSYYEVFPEIQERWRVAHRRCLAGAVEQVDQDCFARADGTTQWLRWQARPWHTAAGAIGGIVIFSEDITDRRHAEQEREALLQEFDRQRQLFKTVVDNTPAGLALLEGPEHRYALVNPGLLAIARDRGSLVGRTVAEVWPEVVGQEAQLLLDHVYRSGEAAEVADLRVMLDRGFGPEESFFNIHCLPLRDERSQVERMLLVATETTQWVQAQRRIEQSEQQFRATFEQAAVGIAHVTLDGRWLRVNQKLCEIVGYNREELLRRSVEDITHPADLNGDRAPMRQLLAGEIDHYATDKRYTRKDGQVIWSRVTVSLLRQIDGTPGYFITVIEDIDERKQTEQALHRLRGEMEQLLAVHIASETAAAIAHELHQPLNAVASYTEAARQLLEMGNPKPERLMHALQEIAAQVQRAGRVVRELMQFLHMKETSTEVVDLYAVMGEAVTIVEANGYGGFQVVKDVAADLKPVQANRLQLQKVLVNLLCNAVEAMPGSDLAVQPMTITMSAAAKGQMALVTVQDDGPGIDKAVVSRIFDPFFSTRPEGLGMGLSVSRALIEANGGTLWTEENASSGAAFHFTLPFAA